jgi:hypothetical protein
MNHPPSIKEIELAIKLVAYGMKFHKMPEALPVLKRFEAYLEQRLAEGDAMDYADRVLDRYTKSVSNDNASPMLESAKAA